MHLNGWAACPAKHVSREKRRLKMIDLIQAKYESAQAEGVMDVGLLHPKALAG